MKEHSGIGKIVAVAVTALACGCSSGGSSTGAAATGSSLSPRWIGILTDSSGEVMRALLRLDPIEGSPGSYSAGLAVEWPTQEVRDVPGASLSDDLAGFGGIVTVTAGRIVFDSTVPALCVWRGGDIPPGTLEPVGGRFAVRLNQVVGP